MSTTTFRSTSEEMMDELLPQDTSDRGTMIFVLGLLGLMVCQICAPIAFFMGQGYKRDCMAQGVRPSGLGQAGYIMGLIGSILMMLSLVLVGLYFCLIFGALVAAGA